MHRRIVTGGLLACCGAFITNMRSAAAWTLITQDQFDEVNQPKPAAAPGTRAGQPLRVPLIEIIEPDITKPIKSPVTIQIRFQASTGASIDPATFRATYGWFNITNQLLTHAKIDSSGISADDAEIPSGRYTVTLQIADNKGRVGTHAVDFQVV